MQPEGKRKKAYDLHRTVTLHVATLLADAANDVGLAAGAERLLARPSIEISSGLEKKGSRSGDERKNSERQKSTHWSVVVPIEELDIHLAKLGKDFRLGEDTIGGGAHIASLFHHNVRWEDEQVVRRVIFGRVLLLAFNCGREDWR